MPSNFTPSNRSNLHGYALFLGLLLTPSFVFLVTLFALLLIFGGHNHANILKNPQCRATPPQPQTPTTLLLQISDIHISYSAPSTNDTLQHFLIHTFPRYIPLASAVLASGDLVNSVTANPWPLGTSSKQYHQEWSIIDHFATTINKTTPWLAVRGNHDSFGGIPQTELINSESCPSSESPIHIFQLPTITIIGLHCTIPHPLHRPLNFFGDASIVEDPLRQQIKHINGPVIVFGHYPSAVMKRGHLIHQVGSGKVVAFLSGHLHTLKGLAPRGLQAVAKDGALELQVPDMKDANMYRVLVMDQGAMAFKDFHINEEQLYVITNPPRAGLCSRGAGSVAMSSTHIRIADVAGVLHGAQVSVDGKNLGGIDMISNCDEVDGKCVPIWGVKWTPSDYDDEDVHDIVIIFNDGSVSDKFEFSLNGQLERGTAGLWRAIVSATFSLSEFDAVAIHLCIFGLFLSLACCIPGLKKRDASTVRLALSVVALAFGPFIGGINLSDKDEGLGFVGLREMRLPSGVYAAGVDVPYIMSVTILYFGLLPVCFLDGIFRSGFKTSFAVLSKNQLNILSISYLTRVVFWCLDVAGAHGYTAVLLSPSCVLLFIVMAGSLTKSKRLMCVSKREPKFKPVHEN